MKNIFIAVLLISALIASFFLGAKLSVKGISSSVDKMQAELSFSHLKMYRDIQSDLLSNCRSRADSRLEFVINKQKMLMAEYVQNNSNEKFENYINLRDKNLIKELRTYEINWDKTWTLPNCKGEQAR